MTTRMLRDLMTGRTFSVPTNTAVLGAHRDEVEQKQGDHTLTLLSKLRNAGAPGDLNLATLHKRDLVYFNTKEVFGPREVWHLAEVQ